jgi:hypothetical protein
VSIVDKLSLIAENQEKVYEAGYEKGKASGGYGEGYEAGQKSMYDENKIIEKTASTIRSVELNDVSEVIHDIHCQLEAVELLDMTKYKMVTTSTAGLYNVGFDISNLIEGQEYIFSSNLPLAARVKIGAYAPSYSSVLIEGDDVTEASFTMTRNPNIAITETQYLFVNVSSSHWARDISELEGYELSIQLVDTNPKDVVVAANDKEYITDDNGFVTIKSDGPIMNISTDSSWKITIDYHKSTGSQSEYDNFWDNFQKNGALTSYQYTFCGSAWNDKTFYPKYNIKLGLGYSGTNAFWSCTVSNIAERLEELGLVLDTTLCGYWSSMFQSTKTKRLPELNCTHAMDYSTSSFQNVFLNSEVETIDKMIVPEDLLYKNNTFQGCSKLKNIIFEGKIAETINFQWSPLSVDSMKSIISCLQNFSGTTSANTKTITFSDACWAALEASGPYPTGGTWEDYVTSLGWNV